MSDAKVVAIIADDMLCEEVTEGDFTLVLDRTPFYGEGGGQVGDSGIISADDMTVLVNDTKKTDGIYLHMCTLRKGIIRVGDSVTAGVNIARREAIRRNHSALHLLQDELRKVLGTHVEQAGSYVDEFRGRFDFTHFSAVEPEELRRVEDLVNEKILEGIPVETVVTDIDEAKKMGAMMLFGEKYGKIVRVVKMGDASTEFCGGTHVDNTAKIGLFHIVSESSVAAGVRRIECVTGLESLKQLREKDALLAETAREIKAQNVGELPKRGAAVIAEVKELKREIEALNAKLAASKLDAIMSGAVDLGKYKLVRGKLEGMNVAAARSLADGIKASHPDTVALLAVVCDGKLNFVCAAGADAVKAGAHAGKLVSAVAAVAGGKGGGRPDSAMAGAPDLSKIDEALDSAAK